MARTNLHSKPRPPPNPNSMTLQKIARKSAPVTTGVKKAIPHRRWLKLLRQGKIIKRKPINNHKLSIILPSGKRSTIFKRKAFGGMFSQRTEMKRWIAEKLEQFSNGLEKYYYLGEGPQDLDFYSILESNRSRWIKQKKQELREEWKKGAYDRHSLHLKYLADNLREFPYNHIHLSEKLYLKHLEQDLSEFAKHLTYHKLRFVINK